MSHEVWEEVYRRLAALVEQHRTTLIFVNTRRMSERVTRRLSELVGEADVAAHHGSLAKEQRLDAEQRLKHGKLKALVATASLELGIDIGDVDLVCQLGSPRSIAAFLQRVGRSGHAVDGTPKGRLFPLSRDDLVECTALLDSVHRGELDRLKIPTQPMDVLAQQIVAEVAATGVERGRPLRAGAAGVALSRPPARGVRFDRCDAGRRVQYAPRPSRRADPSRRGQSPAARPARRAADGAHRRWDHSRQCRLPGAARTREQCHRQRERGFRGREPGRRRLPARQSQLQDPEGRARHGAGRGCAGPAAEHPVLAGRGARPQRRALGLGVAPARRYRAAPALRSVRREHAALADGRTCARPLRRRAAGRLPARGLRRAGLPADARDDRARTLLRRGGRHAAGGAFALRQPAQPGVGPGTAQALLRDVQFRDPGGGDRGQHRHLAHRGA